MEKFNNSGTWQQNNLQTYRRHNDVDVKSCKDPQVSRKLCMGNFGGHSRKSNVP